MDGNDGDDEPWVLGVLKVTTTPWSLGQLDIWTLGVVEWLRAWHEAYPAPTLALD